MKIIIDATYLKNYIDNKSLQTKKLIAYILEQNESITTNKDIEKASIKDLIYNNKYCKNALIDIYKYYIILKF